MSDRSHAPSRSTGDGGRSMLYDLAVWLLIGPSVGLLTVTVIDAIAISLPIHRTDLTLLALALVVVVGAVVLRDFRPSLLAAASYFVLEQVFLAVLWVGFRGFVFQPGGLSTWVEVAVRAIAIALAAGLAFTRLGRLVRNAGRRLLVRFVKLPPDRDPSEAENSR